MGVINKTSLALMKPGAVIIPVSANPVDFDALYVAAWLQYSIPMCSMAAVH